jgi:hypothetical protein
VPYDLGLIRHSQHYALWGCNFLKKMGLAVLSLHSSAHGTPHAWFAHWILLYPGMAPGVFSSGFPITYGVRHFYKSSGFSPVRMATRVSIREPISSRS